VRRTARVHRDPGAKNRAPHHGRPVTSSRAGVYHEFVGFRRDRPCSGRNVSGVLLRPGRIHRSAQCIAAAPRARARRLQWACRCTAGLRLGCERKPRSRFSCRLVHGERGDGRRKSP